MPRAMSSAGDEELLQKTTKLKEDFNEYQQLSNLELQDRQKVLQAIAQMQSWVGDSVSIQPAALGGLGRQVKDAYMTCDGTVVVVDRRGAERKTKLEELDPPTFLSVVQDLTPKLEKLVRDKRKSIIEASAPKFNLKAEQAGDSLALFDWRSFRLLVTNHGGDSSSLTLSVGRAASQRFGPLTVRKGETTNLELHNFRRLSSLKTISVKITCKDAEGHDYKGCGEVRLADVSWQEIPITMTSAIE